LTGRSLLGLLLMLALATGAWSWKNALQKKTLEPERISADVAGFFIKEGEIVTPRPDGTPLYRLVAERMTHSLGSTEIELYGIHVEYNLDSPQLWLMDAGAGQVKTDWNTIRLSDGVRMTFREESDSPAILVTESMIVETGSHTATTDQQVTLELGEEQLTGTGMIADLMAGQVQLESRVNGTFKPRIR
jgi:LPS export ABC transporter protein LptC